jgi:hypothetical protein
MLGERPPREMNVESGIKGMPQDKRFLLLSFGPLALRASGADRE